MPDAGNAPRMTSMTHRTSIWILLCLVLPGCTGSGSRDEKDSRLWNGEVRVSGTLRAMFHEGRTEAMVSLDSVLPNRDLYAVGALADLSGEVAIVAGKVYLSHPGGAEGTLTETPSETNAGATLLVAAAVPAWQSFRSENPIRFEELDDEIAALAAAAGMDVDTRFPFLLVGDFEDLQWHVIDGRRLTAGGRTHQDHLEASTQARLNRASATLVGFYSENDQGVFTHMGSKTHIHCALEEPLSTGHVDHVTIPAGTTVEFPVVGKGEPNEASALHWTKGP